MYVHLPVTEHCFVNQWASKCMGTRPKDSIVLHSKFLAQIMNVRLDPLLYITFCGGWRGLLVHSCWFLEVVEKVQNGLNTKRTLFLRGSSLSAGASQLVRIPSDQIRLRLCGMWRFENRQFNSIRIFYLNPNLSHHPPSHGKNRPIRIARARYTYTFRCVIIFLEPTAQLRPDQSDTFADLLERWNTLFFHRLIYPSNASDRLNDMKRIIRWRISFFLEESFSLAIDNPFELWY